MRRLGLVGCLLAGTAGVAHAQETFTPQTLTVQESIAPGANVFVLHQAWAGPSVVSVLGADDLSMKGNMTPGTTAQMTLTKDAKTLYTTSVYMKRMVYGDVEIVLHEYDVEHLGIKREIIISPKLAHVESQPNLLKLSADEKFILAQNATPATSVSLVDLAAGAQIAEIPIPGCWTFMPSTTGYKFTTLCGDGTLKSVTYAADGSYGDPVASAVIFDPDADALFSNGVRVGEDIVYASFKGNLYVVSDAGDAPVLKEKIALTEGIPGDWAPGGSEVIGYSAPTGVLFLLMHSGATEGSHKDGAEEIWAYDLAKKELLYRSVAHGEDSIAVTQTPVPVVYGVVSEEGALHRYEVDPSARFAAKHAGEAESLGAFTALVLAGE